MAFQIEDVLADRSVFVTGFTGFLGKVLVEKLIYSIPNIKKVYCLVRPQKGQAPSDRVNKILQTTLFDRIREKCPAALSKIQAVAGDMTEDGLGLNQHDHQEICDQVHVVYHCAATVRFDEPLRDAVQMNLLGTARIVALCHSVHNIMCLVHASTAYANCDIQVTEEKVYDPPVAPQRILEAMEWMDDEMTELITPKLLGPRPNTYTLTKALAESFLVEEARNIPTIIVRPSIIGACWREPFPGWTDNLNGATGVLAAVGKGVLANMNGRSQSRADIVPVDIVSNMLIAASVHRIQTQYSDIPVMHCASGDLNPLKWEKVVSWCDRFYIEYPISDTFRIPAGTFHQSYLMWWINWKLYHQIPAHLGDFFNGLMGKKKKYVRLFGKVESMLFALHYFTTHGWLFKSNALPLLWDSLSEHDKEVFNFDIRQVNWDSYMFDYLMGTRKFVLKEELDKLPVARRTLQTLKWYRLLVHSALCYIGVRVFGRNYTKNQRWTAWIASTAVANWYAERHAGRQVVMKSLEDYKKIAKMYHC